MSRELPILCAAPVVRAILDGRQTQDRRPIKPQPPAGEEVWPCHWVKPGFSFTRLSGTPPLRGCTCGGEVRPPWREGDALYVRETWRPYIRGWSSHVQYRAGNHYTDRPVYGPSLGPDASDAAMEWQATRGGINEIECRNPDDVPWFPSIHMPRWAARIRLRALSVTAERVNAISEEDARAEGCDSVAAFGALWDSLYGAGSFDRGDWCWVTRFERVVP